MQSVFLQGDRMTWSPLKLTRAALPEKESFLWRRFYHSHPAAGAQALTTSRAGPVLAAVNASPALPAALELESGPLKVIISGAPASGKGTQCEYIVRKYNLVHISAGDLLRAEVAAGTPNGERVKSYMDAGLLVPDEVVNSIVKERLSGPDAQERGWLLDGYPRSASQANALIADGVVPHVVILLDVPNEIIVQRVIGRRTDPETGKIYHLTFSPPPQEPDLLARLLQRSDDTEEKVQARLETHAQNVGHVVNLYSDKIILVDGNRSKDEVFADIDQILSAVKEQLQAAGGSGNGAPDGATGVRKAAPSPWRGMPTRLNDIPHSREIRHYFYADVSAAVTNAVQDGLSRIRVDLLIPELNPEMDVYRIGTLLELMRELAFTFAAQGKRVKVCVQGSMGSGVFAGMPLQLAGTRRMLEAMDWGQDEADADAPEAGFAQRIAIGAVGANEVTADDEVFLLMAPQNAVGNCIIADLEAMAKAAGSRPVVIINPRLKDLPGAGGVMQVQGRAQRLEFTATFEPCYTLRLLFLSGTLYPILGSLRRAYPGPYEVYKRDDLGLGKEEYKLMDTFPSPPSSSEIAAAFEGRKRKAEAKPEGLWAFFAGILS